MRLRAKLAALLKARRRETFTAGTMINEKQEEAAPVRRPTPMEFGSLPLDPRYGWGIVLEPAEKMIYLLNEFIEQLALEAYYNGEDFQFPREELEARFLTFFDQMVETGRLQRLADAPPKHGRLVVGPKRWINAQQIRISRLVEWWRQQDGPDIEAKV